MEVRCTSRSTSPMLYAEPRLCPTDQQSFVWMHVTELNS